jgi:ribose-phosphate pyrophosphokinase
LSGLLFELSAAPGVADGLCSRLGCARGEVQRRQFPDGESYVRIMDPVAGEDVILLCTLDRPDGKLAPLLFTAAAARAQGARSVGLVAPYLAYMRQDKAFQPGEAVTSQSFAKLVSSHFDWLVTVDPHLHRYRSLAAIYSIPAIAATAAVAIGAWVSAHVRDPVIIGPDEESRQWAHAIAQSASARLVVLRKSRSGDSSVEIDDSALAHLAGGTPVIVDDIASTAATIIATMDLLKRHGRNSPVCAVVHPIFVGDAYQRLVDGGPAKVVSTDTIVHPSNAIHVCDVIADAVAALPFSLDVGRT